MMNPFPNKFNCKICVYKSTSKYLQNQNNISGNYSQFKKVRHAVPTSWI